MTLPISREKTPLISLFIIIMLPFLIFYWMVPFIANQSIGNDYQLTSIENQMELLFSIRTGSFPLFVPGFASDHSASALTLGEVFHPLPHIASILPGYWNGKALQWNTFLRLLSLGLTHLALFVFLRRLTLNVLFSFLFHVSLSTTCECWICFVMERHLNPIQDISCCAQPLDCISLIEQNALDPLVSSEQRTFLSPAVILR